MTTWVETRNAPKFHSPENTKVGFIVFFIPPKKSVNVMTSLPNWKLATGQNFIKPTTKPFSATVKGIWWVKVCCFNLYDEFQCSQRQRLMCALWWLRCIPKQVLSLFCEESSPVWGVLSPFWENLSPIWGLLSPIWGKLSPVMGL